MVKELCLLAYLTAELFLMVQTPVLAFEMTFLRRIIEVERTLNIHCWLKSRTATKQLLSIQLTVAEEKKLPLKGNNQSFLPHNLAFQGRKLLFLALFFCREASKARIGSSLVDEAFFAVAKNYRMFTFYTKTIKKQANHL